MMDTFNFPASWRTGGAPATGNVADVTYAGGNYLWNGANVNSLLSSAQKDSVRARYETPATPPPAETELTDDTAAATPSQPNSGYIAPDFGSIITPFQPLTPELATTTPPAPDYTAFYVVGGIVGLYLLIRSSIK